MQAIDSMPLLDRAYDPDFFRQTGHQLVDLLADHLSRLQTEPDTKVIPYRTPEDELAFWQKGSDSLQPPIDFFRDVLDHSINVHHPRYIGHQVSAPAFVSGLAGMLSDVLNNGTGVYEMGMASNALERVVVDFLAKQVGYQPGAAGFLTSGGTLANLTGLLAARKAKASSPVWEEGHSEKLAVIVSEEAHYCIDRAARILGMGQEGIIKIPVDKQFKIRVDLLDRYRQEAEDKGLKIIAVVGCAGSTATGSYDDLEALADFSTRHDLWFHIDGAHGGGAIFSGKFRHLVNGMEKADSVVIDFHKMLMTPALNTALLFRRGADSYGTFQQRAQYLWDEQQEPEWYHSGKRTFECTKLMLSVKFYSIIKTFGPGIFTENIDRLYGMARAFANMIKRRKDLELLIEPEANIVNFRFAAVPEDKRNDLNASIRQQLLETGQFYIVQTVVEGRRYLRCTIMNPRTREEDLQQLLNAIEEIAMESAYQPIAGK